MMKEIKVCCFVLSLQIVTWVVATTRPFPSSTNAFHVNLSGPAQSPESPQPTTKQGIKKDLEEVEMGKMVNHRGWRKIGSSPPSCEHKCYGCFPCEAIQVPTTTKHSHFGVQYTNYEPEGWKCKCGPSFYSP